MRDVSTFRLYLLRATYLLIVVGLGIQIWPGVVQHSITLPLMNGVVRSLLAAIALLSLFGLRYPLQMLPLLLFELAWKSIWLLAFALRLWLAHRIDADTADSVFACVMGVVICLIAIPWPYVFAHYARKPGDRWRWRSALPPGAPAQGVQTGPSAPPPRAPAAARSRARA